MVKISIWIITNLEIKQRITELVYIKYYVGMKIVEK